MRLLVIEDDEALRESLCRQLADNGFGIEQAADGREGLYFAMEYPIDLAIVDLGLPEMSGLDVIRELRDKGKTYPILILTARDRWQDKVDGLDAGAEELRLNLSGRYDVRVMYRHPCSTDFELGAAIPVSATVSFYDGGHADPYDSVTFTGQVVGMMNEERSVRDVMFEMISDCVDTVESLHELLDRSK